LLCHRVHVGFHFGAGIGIAPGLCGAVPDRRV